MIRIWRDWLGPIALSTLLGAALALACWAAWTWGGAL